MTDDTKDQKPSLGSKTRQASSAPKSISSERSGDGNRLEEPIGRRTGGGVEDVRFVKDLILRLIHMEQPFRLAKVMRMDNEIEVMGFRRDAWAIEDSTTCIRGWKFHAFPASQFQVPGYETYAAVGMEFSLPLSSIKGFGWSKPDEEEHFFATLWQYTDPN